MPNNLRLFGVGALVFALGCGGNNSNNGTDAGLGDLAGGGADLAMVVPPSLAMPSGFEANLAAAQCATSAKCGYIGTAEEKQCENDALLAAQNYPRFYSLDDAVAKGRLKYDMAAAMQCLTAIRAMGCLDSEPAVCSTVYAPLVNAGGMCLSSQECVGGTCNMTTGFSDGCPGTCQAWLADGATCDLFNDQCNPKTSYCNPLPGDAGTTSGSCTALPGAGASCDTSSCQSGLNCIYPIAADGGIGPSTCRAPGAVGDPCTSTYTCKAGLWCDDTSVCAMRVAAGASCTSTDACQDGLDCVGYDPSMTPTTAGKCTAWFDVGSACDPAQFETGCPYDQQCDMTTKKCVAVGAAGSDCSVSFCRANLYCDATNKCAPEVALGGACDPNAAVDPCQAGTCDATSKTCTVSCQ